MSLIFWNSPENSDSTARRHTTQIRNTNEMEWGEFSDRFPRAHLVSGEYDPTEHWKGQARFGVLGRLVLSLTPRGTWAINKMSRNNAIYVAYEVSADALRLRTAVGAVKAAPALQRHRWLTHYEFWFDRAMRDALVRKVVNGEKPSLPQPEVAISR
jgi:hypothetical protein